MAGAVRCRDHAVGRARDTAVPALAKALADPNADVREAVVPALGRHRTSAEARSALATATADSDADVRARAARGL
ncbi:HEAT repeat domain-containing protein [Streptomyces sp. NPDC052727]|uniref:HEAT repeat domain-containing protein n=1 Tax=Streptomyces sp. NPDC052727 TaxID=3154854 RepID=UPI003449AC07